MVGAVRFLTEGFLLGLATGHICLVTCGPIYAPFLMQNNLSHFRYLAALFYLSLGRFITYVSVGALAGLFGHKVSEIQREYFTLAAYVLFSIFLLISALRSRKCEKGCAVGKWSRFSEWPLILGMATGINICPSFLIAFTRSFELSGPLAGAFFFMSFFAGTTIFLIPLSFVGMLGRQYLFRRIARISAIVIAGWFIVSAVRISYDMFKPYFDHRPVISLMDESPLYVLLKERESAEKVAHTLASHRKGPVHIISSFDQLPPKGYVLTQHWEELLESELRAPGRFVAILDDNKLADSLSVENVAQFLGKYYFRFDTNNGDIFHIK
ncbi:MAG TPA: sulfite exporter TauE/SafE family protein [Chitinispirillaceae bacterium]|nr:sulfite exporter TauE/SafE family protein [Chitinispirillaceae bacterium]